jgi:hypothetical protein
MSGAPSSVSLLLARKTAAIPRLRENSKDVF